MRLASSLTDALIMANSYPTLTLLKRRRTRIVATVGPACEKPAVLEELIRSGVDVFRLNCSHSDHARHRTAYEAIRAASQRVGIGVAVLADLCGPKIRVGQFPGGQIELTDGQHVVVTTRDIVGGPGLIPSQYHALHQDVHPGDRILLDDGLIELRVERVDDRDIACVVVYGGILKDRKGMNLPGVAVSAPALTDKDCDDARFALELGVDFLALSFVRRPADVEDLKRLIAAKGQTTPVIAKIEKPEALPAINDILDAADGIMVARGDLGVELSPEVVPIAQQDLVLQARRKCKPVIVATQMLESMVENAWPTRAEVSDVSTAVFSGADAVMLSAETSVGAHPIEAVRMMDRVARQVEGWQWTEGAFRSLTRAEEQPAPLPLSVAVARATAQLSRDLRVRGILVQVSSGLSASVISASRPAAPVVAFSTDPAICRRLNLLWGVIPRVVEEADFENPPEVARKLASELGLARSGEVVLLLSGFGKGEPVITVLPL
jgi:pyruvate kinase